MKLFRKRRRRSSLKHNLREPQSVKRKTPNSTIVKKWAVLIVILSSVLIGIYFVVFSNQFLISEIIVKQDEIYNDNNPLQHYFNSIKGQNIIFTKTDDIHQRILADHPEIETLKIKKRLPKTLQVEYTDFPIIVNLLQNTELGQKKFLINSQGQIVKKDVENPNLPYIKIDSEEEFKTKDKIIKPERLTYILESIKYFEEKFGMKVFDVNYLKEAREIHLRTEKYFNIWLDLTQKYEDQFAKLKRALLKLDIYNDPLDYIDLRIAGSNGEKVIFKRK